MAPKRRAAERKGGGRPRRTVANETAENDEEIPEIFQEMLAEATRRTPSLPDRQSTTVKRRRLDETSSQLTALEAISSDASLDNVAKHSESKAKPVTSKEQVVFEDFAASDEDDEDDEDFEDVDLEAGAEAGIWQESADENLQLDLSKKPREDASATARRRKPATAVERKMRLDVHKWHVLCLLAHLRQRNNWCEDEQVQATLKTLIPRKLSKLLHLDASQPQYQRTYSFNAALDEISKIWRGEWKITEQGMRRSYWNEEPNDLHVDGLPDPVNLQDFRDAAGNRSGSRDLGAQLFCSLLRATAVDTRLVCSLQPLPFSGMAKGGAAGQSKPQYIMATSLGQQPDWSHHNAPSTLSNSQQRINSPGSNTNRATPHVNRAHKSIRDSPYPIFWVEVFSDAIQKWIPIDPLVRKTINKPKTGFEPPTSDALNKMVYAVAFEEDGSARDVTRRYTQFYNGKTRRSRVESTKGGQRWWERTMACLEKHFPEDRDEIEDAEFLAREESEQMPKNVQNFKNHPHYVLERHLKRNEVIHPRREVGKVGVGQSRDAKLEPIFRRRDLLIVKTTDQWYRLGRDVKIGERPLKEVILLRRNDIKSVEDEAKGDSEEKAMLYAESQTEVYIPPSVVNGKVPRNAYGNLDVYVRSMIPAGGIHVRHPEAARAAKVLGVHYVNAVTGFEFKGRKGTAVLSGVVAAAEYHEAFVEVLEAIRYERTRENIDKRSAIALQMWKRFLTALRIRENVNKKYADGESQFENESEEAAMDGTYQEDESDNDEAGGGFFPEPTAQAEPLQQPVGTQPLDSEHVFDLQPVIDHEAPIVIHESPHKVSQENSAGPEQELNAQNLPHNVTSNHHRRISTEWDGFTTETEVGPIHPDDGVGAGRFLVDHSPIHMSSAKIPRSKDSKSPIDISMDNAPEIPDSNNSVAQCLGNDNSTAETRQNPQSNYQSPHPPRLSRIIADPATATAAKSSIAQPSQPANEREDINPTTTTALNDGKNNIYGNSIQAEGKDEESDTSLEQGSLLSHDPEDDNAEPDWLAEVLDSD